MDVARKECWLAGEKQVNEFTRSATLKLVLYVQQNHEGDNELFSS
jgi:hypothetical protein